MHHHLPISSRLPSIIKKHPFICIFFIWQRDINQKEKKNLHKKITKPQDPNYIYNYSLSTICFGISLCSPLAYSSSPSPNYSKKIYSFLLTLFFHDNFVFLFSIQTKSCYKNSTSQVIVIYQTHYKQIQTYICVSQIWILLPRLNGDGYHYINC